MIRSESVNRLNGININIFFTNDDPLYIVVNVLYTYTIATCFKDICNIFHFSKALWLGTSAAKSIIFQVKGGRNGRDASHRLIRLNPEEEDEESSGRTSVCHVSLISRRPCVPDILQLLHRTSSGVL